MQRISSCCSTGLSNSTPAAFCRQAEITPMTSLWHHQGYFLRLGKKPLQSHRRHYKTVFTVKLFMIRKLTFMCEIIGVLWQIIVSHSQSFMVNLCVLSLEFLIYKQIAYQDHHHTKRRKNVFVLFMLLLSFLLYLLWLLALCRFI